VDRAHAPESREREHLEIDRRRRQDYAIVDQELEVGAALHRGPDPRLGRRRGRSRPPQLSPGAAAVGGGANGPADLRQAGPPRGLVRHLSDRVVYAVGQLGEHVTFGWAAVVAGAFDDQGEAVHAVTARRELRCRQFDLESLATFRDDWFDELRG
jgi:hypothetical protein